MLQHQDRLPRQAMIPLFFLLPVYSFFYYYYCSGVADTQHYITSLQLAYFPPGSVCLLFPFTFRPFPPSPVPSSSHQFVLCSHESVHLLCSLYSTCQ